METRIQCYIADGQPELPFKYNPDLNAGPDRVHTEDYQGPHYKTGGVKAGKDFSVFMGVKPTSEAAECFASNKSDGISLNWAKATETSLKAKLLGCDAEAWTKEKRVVRGKEETVHVSSFNVPQCDLPLRYGGDLKNWEFGPTTEPLNLDFSNGINGEVGMITVGNNKYGGVPDINRSNWNDNVQVIWDTDLGKYVGQLDTYMIYKKIAGVGDAWTIKNTGGLITTRMYASGKYEVRAKVPKAPGLVWAIWTFWGNEIYSYRQSKSVLHRGPSTHFIPCSDSPMWLDQSTDCGTLLPEPGKQYPNHEIDIEIPSNAPQTVSGDAAAKKDKYDTMNMNCYRWTNHDGTGSYNNLFCHNKKAPFIGDGEYHTYRFDWHTGDLGRSTSPCVDFYFDNNYIGTNDAFVPFIAGRLWVMFVAPKNGQPGGSGDWNGIVDQSFHQPLKLGDVARYASVKVDYVRITPFNEPNDHYAPSAFDQPCMGAQPGCVNCGRHNPDPRLGTLTSILPYTTASGIDCGGIKWKRKTINCVK